MATKKQNVQFGEKYLTCASSLSPNSDVSETSHCNMKGLSVREVMRIENMITKVKFS